MSKPSRPTYQRPQRAHEVKSVHEFTRQELEREHKLVQNGGLYMCGRCLTVYFSGRTRQDGEFAHHQHLRQVEEYYSERKAQAETEESLYADALRMKGPGRSIGSL